MKAAPMTQKPAFRLMKLGDVQSVYHLQMPRWLFTDPRYTALSLEAKVAYTFLLNRFQLSRLNGWINDAGEVFIIYTRKSLADEMQVSYRKVIDSMKELSAAGLIWERRCGRGDANQIYLALVEHQECRNSSAPFVSKKHEAAGAPPAEEAGTRSAETELLQAQQHGAGPSVLRQEVPEQHLQKSQTGTSASTGTAHPEVPVSHPSYTDPNRIRSDKLAPLSAFAACLARSRVCFDTVPSVASLRSVSCVGHGVGRRIFRSGSASL